MSIVQQTQRAGRFRRISCYPNVLVVFVLFRFCFENNVTLFCYSNLSFSARKEVSHEWLTTPLIRTPVYGLLFPRIASFLMMDNLAYWNHARIGGSAF